MRRNRRYLIHQRERIIAKRQEFIDSTYQVENDIGFQYCRRCAPEFKKRIYKFAGQLSKTNVSSLWSRRILLKGFNTRWLQRASVLRRMDSLKDKYEDL